ncbi:MAG TPA: M17 family peptidase N-terminal domain-containing protein, partial [Candidatus Acidoferrales bacterium]|nr:M17 family peptidase N-terminal domain-containing protein [Candidatus Acidoferrales bacterium]
MDVKLRDIRVDAIKTDLLVLPTVEKELEESPLYALDRRVRGKLRERIEKSRFTGAEGSALLFSSAGTLPASNLLLLGMGKSQEIEPDTWRKAAARARKEASNIGAAEIAFYFNPPTELDNAAGAVVEGMLLASYQFNKYRSNSKPPSEPKGLTLFKPGLKRSAAMEKSIRAVEQTTPGVFLARDLINEPPSVTTATFLGAQAQRHCRGRGLAVEVWGKTKIESMHLAG